MLHPAALLAVVPLAAALSMGQPGAAPEKTEQIPPDPVQAVWHWLATGPARSSAAANPGAAAFDLALRGLDTRQPEALPRAALAARLGAQMLELPDAQQATLIEYLAAHEELAAELAFLLGPHDQTVQAYAVLNRLIEAHADRVAELAPLAAAICVVHDQPRDWRINENTVPLIDPVELFGYYAANERSMMLDLRQSPATLLVHLADAAGTLEEYEWARKRYARDKNIGNRYAEITYDTRALKQEGVDKRVTEAGGYSLQSIRQLGGVCADQAYFALSVGKACGIPACYVRGKTDGAGHAWVGFVEQTGRRGIRWDFSAGRFGDYEEVRGSVTDPQTWLVVPDADLAVASASASIPLDRRRQSAALVDAASRLGYAVRQSGQQGAPPETRASQLDLLEAALRLDPGNLAAWRFARNLIATPDSTLEQKEHWTQAVDQLAAQSYPDFAFEFVEPIFRAEEDLGVKLNLWDWAATRFAPRPDLAARARLAQTRVMIEQNRKPDAVTAARAVFDRYADAGPAAVEALTLAEQLLTELGQPGEALAMYEGAFRRLRQPGRMNSLFFKQTTWYQVGSRYAELLEDAGDTRKAQTLRKRLEP